MNEQEVSRSNPLKQRMIISHSKMNEKEESRSNHLKQRNQIIIKIKSGTKDTKAEENQAVIFFPL